MDGVTIRTNFHHRDVIDAWSLTPAERKEFDYLDWSGIEEGTASASFFRYRGQLYDIGEFTTDYGITRGTGLPDYLARWDAYMSESFFSALAIRYVDDFEGIVVALILS